MVGTDFTTIPPIAKWVLSVNYWEGGEGEGGAPPTDTSHFRRRINMSRNAAIPGYVFQFAEILQQMDFEQSFGFTTQLGGKRFVHDVDASLPVSVPVSLFMEGGRGEIFNLNIRLCNGYLNLDMCGSNKILLADASQYLGGEFLCWMLLERRKFYSSSAHS